jgi:hypothetical protein
VKPQSGPPDWLGGLLVLAFSLTLIMTLLISTFTPAVETYYGLKVDPAQFTSLDASMYSAQLRDIRCATARCGISNCSRSPALYPSRASMRHRRCSTSGRFGRCAIWEARRTTKTPPQKTRRHRRVF